MSLRQFVHNSRNTQKQRRWFAAFVANPPLPKANDVGAYQVFDRNVKRIQKDRAALRDGGARSRTVDYVRDEVADRMMERFLVSWERATP